MFKKINYVLLLVTCKAIFAADSIGVQVVDQNLTWGQQAVKMLAKWGGIGVIIIGALAWGFGEVKGGGAWKMIGGIIGVLGLIWIAFNIWTGQFSQGFAF